MTIDQDKACEHHDFAVVAEISRLTKTPDAPVQGFTCDLTIHCMDCKEPFRFIGMSAGLSPREPMCSVDETEARLPIRPASSDPDFGMGIPGFAIAVRVVDDDH
jgi:hypothetical protein